MYRRCRRAALVPLAPSRATCALMTTRRQSAPDGRTETRDRAILFLPPEMTARVSRESRALRNEPPPLREVQDGPFPIRGLKTGRSSGSLRDGSTPSPSHSRCYAYRGSLPYVI